MRPDKWLYICGDCAEARGGQWPPGDVATFHRAPCDLCHQPRWLAAAGDWNWPTNHPLRNQQANRD